MGSHAIKKIAVRIQHGQEPLAGVRRNGIVFKRHRCAERQRGVQRFGAFGASFGLQHSPERLPTRACIGASNDTIPSRVMTYLLE